MRRSTSAARAAEKASKLPQRSSTPPQAAWDAVSAGISAGLHGRQVGEACMSGYFEYGRDLWTCSTYRTRASGLEPAEAAAAAPTRPPLPPRPPDLRFSCSIAAPGPWMLCAHRPALIGRRRSQTHHRGRPACACVRRGRKLSAREPRRETWHAVAVVQAGQRINRMVSAATGWPAHLSACSRSQQPSSSAAAHCCGYSSRCACRSLSARCTAACRCTGSSGCAALAPCAADSCASAAIPALLAAAGKGLHRPLCGVPLCDQFPLQCRFARPSATGGEVPQEALTEFRVKR
jgi:hypothetical protein